MKGWLLDTNVLSELSRPSPDNGVLSFVSCQSKEAWISDINIAEIENGMRMQRLDERRMTIRRWLDSVVLPMFAGRILPISKDIILEVLGIMHETRRMGFTISTPDLLIAGSAVAESLVVVSRDSKPYRQAEGAVLDPWSALFYGPGCAPQPVDLNRTDLLEKLA
jgi:predicted nucleic acid-binding protein